MKRFGGGDAFTGAPGVGADDDDMIGDGVDLNVERSNDHAEERAGWMIGSSPRSMRRSNVHEAHGLLEGGRALDLDVGGERLQ